MSRWKWIIRTSSDPFVKEMVGDVQMIVGDIMVPPGWLEMESSTIYPIIAFPEFVEFAKPLGIIEWDDIHFMFAMDYQVIIDPLQSNDELRCGEWVESDLERIINGRATRA